MAIPRLVVKGAPWLSLISPLVLTNQSEPYNIKLASYASVQCHLQHYCWEAMGADCVEGTPLLT